MKLINRFLTAIAFIVVTSSANAYEVRLGYATLTDNSNTGIIQLSSYIRNHDVFVIQNLQSLNNARRILNTLNVYSNEYSIQTTRVNPNSEGRSEAIIWRNTSVDYDGNYAQYSLYTSGFTSAPLSIAFKTRQAGGHPFIVSSFDIKSNLHNKWQAGQFMNQYVRHLNDRFKNYRLKVFIGDGVFVPSNVSGFHKTETGFYVPENLNRNHIDVNFGNTGIKTLTINFPDSRVVN